MIKREVGVFVLGQLRWLVSPDVRGVEDDAGDVDEVGVVEPVQHGLVEAAPDAGSRPDQKSAVSLDFDMPKHGGS
ncbi:hypothetical protein QFZ55_007827 [Streptomyces luteogriseus]|nr:hypothetical protein [Streptomyces luteogriseus]